jgi:hypothetical protein
MHWAYTAIMIHGQHYKLYYGQRYELHYDPRYVPIYAAIHA